MWVGVLQPDKISFIFSYIDKPVRSHLEVGISVTISIFVTSKRPEIKRKCFYKKWSEMYVGVAVGIFAKSQTLPQI